MSKRTHFFVRQCVINKWNDSRQMFTSAGHQDPHIPLTWREGTFIKKTSYLKQVLKFSKKLPVGQTV